MKNILIVLVVNPKRASRRIFSPEYYVYFLPLSAVSMIVYAAELTLRQNPQISSIFQLIDGIFLSGIVLATFSIVLLITGMTIIDSLFNGKGTPFEKLIIFMWSGFYVVLYFFFYVIITFSFSINSSTPLEIIMIFSAILQIAIMTVMVSEKSQISIRQSLIVVCGGFFGMLIFPVIVGAILRLVA